MKITVENFTLETDPQGGFNLVETRTIEALDKNRKPTGELKEISTDRGYNMSLERCIQKMLHLSLHSINNTVDLRAFLELYRGERFKLEELLQRELTNANNQ